MFVGLLALDLLPVGIYASAVRNPPSVYWCGALLVVIYTGAWNFVAALDDPLKGIYPVLGFVVSLLIALVPG